MAKKFTVPGGTKPTKPTSATKGSQMIGLGKPRAPSISKKPSILIAIGAPKIAPMPKGKSKKAGY